jgi:hypothetical protein
MPCICDGMEAATARDRERELDRLARLLCEACEIIQATRGGIAMTSGLREWWFAHESADRRRAAATAAKVEEARRRDDGLRALTETQAAALGLLKEWREATVGWA